MSRSCRLTASTLWFRGSPFCHAACACLFLRLWGWVNNIIKNNTLPDKSPNATDPINGLNAETYVIPDERI